MSGALRANLQIRSPLPEEVPRTLPTLCGQSGQNSPVHSLPDSHVLQGPQQRVSLLNNGHQGIFFIIIPKSCKFQNISQFLQEFPICKHQIELPCDWDIANERCQQECGMILDCEHICTAKCHKRTSHDEVDCRQPCSRTVCPEKHPCPKKCFQECGPCQYDVIKTLPCSHKV